MASSADQGLTSMATLPPEVVAEAEGRGRERDLQGTAAEVLAELEEVVGV